MDYNIRVTWSEEDELYIARCLEFRGVAAHGDTPEEAVGECAVALEGMVEAYTERGWELPTPFPVHNYSGKLSLRIGASLHEQVADRAQEEGLSINSLLQQAVSYYMGQPLEGKRGEVRRARA